MSALVSKQDKIIEFCHLLLDKVVILMAAESENSTELVHLIFSVCSLFTTGMLEVSEEARRSLESLLPVLGRFRQICGEEDSVEMARGLEESVLRVLGRKTAEAGKKEEAAHRVLIEEVEDEYEACMRDLRDALVPVRAHGLVSLRRLIEKRDIKVGFFQLLVFVLLIVR